MAFSGDGILVQDVPGSVDSAADALLTPDGKIVVVGYAAMGGTTGIDLLAARFTADGQLDTTFGDSGTKTVDFDGGYDVGAAVDGQGRLFLAGTVTVGGQSRFGVVCLTSGGQLDTNFSGDGRADVAVGTVNNWATAVAVQADGKVVVGGLTYSGNPGDDDFALARFTAAGDLDTTFGSAGTVVTSVDGNHDLLRGLTIQPDGKIVAVGYAMRNGQAARDMAVLRYNADGTLGLETGTGLVSVSLSEVDRRQSR